MRGGRERFVLLLADTIKDPDEIRWVWEEFPKGRWTLLRRYIERWRIGGSIVSFERILRPCTCRIAIQAGAKIYSLTTAPRTTAVVYLDTPIRGSIE